MNPGIRYQPLRGNSGFYYVRNNERTRSAMKDAMLKTDQLEASRSQQQTLLELLSEHISYHGLRVKTYDGDDTNYFPTGGQFHKNRRFMKQFLRGELDDVFLFHMNWTKNKKEKLNYLKQLGMWFVEDTCYNKPLRDILESHGKLSNMTDGYQERPIVQACCSAEPLFSCHYRDKPSIQPCKDSPPYAHDGRIWW